MNAIKPSIIVTYIFDCVDVQKIVILTKSRVKKAGCDSVYAFKVFVLKELKETYSLEIQQQCLLEVGTRIILVLCFYTFVSNV